MTKLDATYKLSRALSDTHLTAISRLYSVFGIFAVRVQPSQGELWVEYDAARLTAADLRNTLERNGIPLAD